MTSVITGDIIRSGKYTNPERWLVPLKKALTKTGIANKYWEVYRGDSFQIEIKNPSEAFKISMYIKASIKTVKELDVRMAIGVGNKNFEGETVTESNGEVFQFSGETLENLKREKVNLKIKTNSSELDNELNLYFKFALIAMDNWTMNSAEVVKLSIEHPNKKQEELAQLIGISQDAVSKRQKRAHLDILMELNYKYQERILYLKK